MKLPKWLVVFGIVLCLAVMCFSGYQVFNILADYRAGDAINEMVQQYADLEPPQKSEFPIPKATVESGTPIAESEVDPVVYPQVDFDSLLQINSDVVGWIYIEDTAINYPIVLGEDNEKYVRTSVDGKYSYYGSIFMDYRNAADFSDQHTVIYGHHMKNGAMFQNIRKYDDPQFYADHPTGMIMTPEQNFQFEVIGGYVAGASENAWKLQFDNQQDYYAWLQDSMARSTIGGTIIPTAEDRIITLSTCTYEFSDARFVLLCRIIEE